MRQLSAVDKSVEASSTSSAATAAAVVAAASRNTQTRA